MKQSSDLTELMLQALEGSLSEESWTDLRTQIEQDPELKHEWEELKRLANLLQDQQFQLKPFLATRVEARLNQELSLSPTPLPWKRAFGWITLPVAAMALGLMTLTLVQEKDFSLDILGGQENISVEEIWAAEWSPTNVFDP